MCIYVHGWVMGVVTFEFQYYFLLQCRDNSQQYLPARKRFKQFTVLVKKYGIDIESEISQSFYYWKINHDSWEDSDAADGDSSASPTDFY